MDWKGLISEDGKKLSIGRVSFWVVFILCIYFWLLKDKEAFPPTLFDTFVFVLGYNVAKKPINVFSKYIDTKYGNNNNNT